MRITLRAVIAAAAIVPAISAAQQRPPVRQIGPIVAKSTENFASIAGVRALSDGRVLVNDITGRRLILFDPMLGTSTVVADTSTATSNAYAGQTGGLIPFRGDSSMFVDPSSMSMLIVDGSGKIARVMSVPRTQDVNMLAGALSTSVGFDPRGRLVYRAPPRPRGGGFGPGGPGGGGAFTPPVIPESLAIVRVDLATRAVDTVAYGRIPKVKLDIVQDEGRIRVTSEVNPLPTVDDFAMLPDGTVALVRGSDYHVDYFKTDGTKVSAPKIPFDWQRLSDEDKVAFIDSVKAVRARQLAANPTAGGLAAAIGAAGAGGGGGGGGGPQITIIGGDGGGPGGGRRAGGGGGGGGGGGAAGGGGGGGGGGFGAQINFVPPSELPDYKPAFFAGATKVDAQGNLWIRTIPTKKIDGGPVYDVINTKGELVDRVQVPLNSTIAGFGADGSVYLSVQNDKVFNLQRAKLK